MSANATIQNRRSIRFKEWDYSQAGCYFVTIVSHKRLEIFGELIEGTVRFSVGGKIIASKWGELETRFPNVELGDFVIMPNHLHAIITILETPRPARTDVNKVEVSLVSASSHDDCDLKVGAPLVGARDNGICKRAATRAAPTKTRPTLGYIIGGFKSRSTLEYMEAVRRGDLQPFAGKIWQRNYYDRIIRSEQEFGRIQQYILTNPLCWEEDSDNPAADSGRNSLKEMADKLYD